MRIPTANPRYAYPASLATRAIYILGANGQRLEMRTPPPPLGPIRSAAFGRARTSRARSAFSYDDQLDIKFESRLGDPWDSWLRLQYTIYDYWTGDPYQIDDKIFLTTTRPPFGGYGGGLSVRA
jgi:hypothetical protein